MGVFSSLAALSPLLHFVPGVGTAAAVGVSAVAGAAAARERNQEIARKRKIEANAAADAIAVSSLRKDGTGSIPGRETKQESESGNILAGGVAGLMQGVQMGKVKEDGLFGKAAGSVAGTTLGAQEGISNIESMKYPIAGMPTQGTFASAAQGAPMRSPAGAPTLMGGYAYDPAAPQQPTNMFRKFGPYPIR